MTNKEILFKKIIYRSSHRGSKEMDLLLGNFVKQNIISLNLAELKNLYNLLNIEDEVLKNWFYSKNNKKLVPVNSVSKLLKKFKF